MQRFCDDGYKAFAFRFPLAKLVHDQQFRASKAALDRHDSLLERAGVEDAAACQTSPIFADPNDWACQSASKRGSVADLVQLNHQGATFWQSLTEVADGVMVFATRFSASRA